MKRQRNVTALLDKGRRLCTPATWYQLAKRTGIAETTISRCRRRGGTLSDENAYKLAALLGMQPLDVILYMNEDRARDPQTRKFWTDRLPRILPSLATACALLLAGWATLSGGRCEARPTDGHLRGDNLYIMRSRRRLRSRQYAILAPA